MKLHIDINAPNRDILQQHLETIRQSIASLNSGGSYQIEPGNSYHFDIDLPVTKDTPPPPLPPIKDMTGGQVVEWLKEGTQLHQVHNLRGTVKEGNPLAGPWEVQPYDGRQLRLKWTPKREHATNWADIVLPFKRTRLSRCSAGNLVVGDGKGHHLFTFSPIQPA